MITERVFDTVKGIQIPEITLHNSNGMEVSILSYGATIRSVFVPSSTEKKYEVCLGYDTIREYIENSGHFGGSIGRFANRIANAAFDLDGKHYELAANTPRTICTAVFTAGTPRSGSTPPIPLKTA